MHSHTLLTLATLAAFACATPSQPLRADDALPSWNDGPAKSAIVQFVDDGPGKPVGIQTHLGRRPLAAFGNSDGDLQMLQWTAAGPGPRFCLYVHHTDAQREWAYDRASNIGTLNKGLDEARIKGWTVVDMKTDWNRVFPFETK